jgi:release factor glutamine methyltransferase
VTRGEAYRWAVGELSASGVDSPPLDASLLLGHALGVPRQEALLARDLPVPRPAIERFRALVGARARRAPVSRLVGSRGFYGLDLSVTPDVLTPRPETEHLVEWALERLGDPGRPARVLDLGTGSGAIAVALAVNRPDLRVTAVDISPAALAVARRNAEAHGVAGRIAFLCSDLDSALGESRFDLVVSNPPYIREDEEPLLPPEVREHEPRCALIAGPRGTEFHLRIAGLAGKRLAPGGALGVEVGAGQAPEVAQLFRSAGLSHVAVTPDYAGIARVVTGTGVAAGRIDG